MKIDPNTTKRGRAYPRPRSAFCGALSVLLHLCCPTRASATIHAQPLRKIRITHVLELEGLRLKQNPLGPNEPSIPRVEDTMRSRCPYMCWPITQVLRAIVLIAGPSPGELPHAGPAHRRPLLAGHLPAGHLPAIFVLLLIMSAVISGRVHAQRILMEDFLYAPGDSLTPHGWSSSSATSPILTSSEGLQFGSYQGSGVGNAAILKSTGQDVQKEFAPDSTGKIYVWALVNVSSAKSGDYFLHLQPNTGSSVYVGRTYARLASNGGLTFGVAKRGTNTLPTVVYSDSVYAVGTTYLLVMKYEFKSGSSSNDEVTLYVFANGEVPPGEPAMPAVGPVADATADPALLGAVALRQGDQSRALVLTLDGIRITRGWGAFLPATLDSMQAVLSISPPGALLSWRAWTEVSVEGYHVDRRSRMDDIFIPLTAAMIPAVGATGYPVEYTFLDTSVGAGVAKYRLRLLTMGGGEAVADSISFDLPTGVAAGHDQSGSPFEFAGSNIHPVLMQNYPNPFNPKSIIRFTSPITEEISIDLYDILGRHHGLLFHGTAEAGREYEVAVDGSTLCTGAYVARLTSKSGVAVRKLLVVR